VCLDRIEADTLCGVLDIPNCQEENRWVTRETFARIIPASDRETSTPKSLLCVFLRDGLLRVGWIDPRHFSPTPPPQSIPLRIQEEMGEEEIGMGTQDEEEGGGGGLKIMNPGPTARHLHPLIMLNLSHLKSLIAIPGRLHLIWLRYARIAEISRGRPHRAFRPGNVWCLFRIPVYQKSEMEKARKRI